MPESFEDRGLGGSSGSRPTQDERGISLPQVNVVPNQEAIQAGEISQRDVSVDQDRTNANLQRAWNTMIPRSFTNTLLEEAWRLHNLLFHPTSPIGPCQQAAIAESLELIHNAVGQRWRRGETTDHLGRPIPIFDIPQDDPLGPTMMNIPPFGFLQEWQVIQAEQSRICESRTPDRMVTPRPRRRRQPLRRRLRRIPDTPRRRLTPQEFRERRDYLCSRIQQNLREYAVAGTFARWYLSNIQICTARPNPTNVGGGLTFTVPSDRDLEDMNRLLERQVVFSTADSCRFLRNQRALFGTTVQNWYAFFVPSSSQIDQGEAGRNFLLSPQWNSFCEFIEDTRPDLECGADMGPMVRQLRYMNGRTPDFGASLLDEGISRAARAMWPNLERDIGRGRGDRGRSSYRLLQLN